MYNEFIIRNIIAQKTKDFRNKNNLEIDGLAQKLGVSVTEVIDIENSKSELNLDTLIKLTNTLGLTMDELFSVENADSDLEEVIRIYRSLDKKLQKSLKIIFRTLDSGSN